MLSLYFNRLKKYQLYNSLAWSRINKWLTKLSVILLFFYLNYHLLKTKWTWLKRSQRTGKTKYSHLIFQMTSILTTISATKRARPTNQVFDGSNNNLFIHSIKKCESKSFQFDFALFLRTAILSLLSTTLEMSCHWLCTTFGFTRRFPIIIRSVEEFSNAQTYKHGEISAAAFGNHCHFCGFIPWKRPFAAADMLLLWYEYFIFLLWLLFSSSKSTYFIVEDVLP